uniref:Uncharacterized protein n=1 Tax=Chenopodium quinoa TaxID=63459 RepID=A0A803MBM6_CHEQI
MLSRSNDVAWVDDTADQNDAVSWTRPPPHPPQQPPLDGADWYLTGGHIITPPSEIGNDNLLLPSTLQTTSSFSSQPQFDPLLSSSSLQQQHQLPFFPFSAAKSSLSSFYNHSPFESSAYNFCTEPGFLPPVHATEPGSCFELPGFGFSGLDGLDSNSALFGNRVKMLMPLEVGPSTGPGLVEPSLFQKRVMVRSSSTGSDKLGELGGGFWGGRGKRKRESNNGNGDVEEDDVEGSFGVSMMDRASILGDAIDYLKELLERISELHNELESSNPGPLMPTSSHPSTLIPPTLPCRVKEEISPNSLPVPKNQLAR